MTELIATAAVTLHLQLTRAEDFEAIREALHKVLLTPGVKEQINQVLAEYHSASGLPDPAAEFLGAGHIGVEWLVDQQPEPVQPAGPLAEPEFVAFLRGYTDALLWSSTDEVDGETVNLDGFPTTTQLDDRCRADCLKFFTGNRGDIYLAAQAYGTDDGFASAGHDFALTRNGHGAGFWDGDLPKDLGDRLTTAAREAGECSLYVNDSYQVEVV